MSSRHAICWLYMGWCFGSAFGLAAAVALLPAIAGCTPTNTGAGAAESSPVSACAAAGGQCAWRVCSEMGMGPQDCGPGGGTCCLDEVNARICAADGGLPAIEPSSYDGTCMVDSDCVAVGAGDPCSSVCEILCGGSVAINKSSLARYNADVARIPASFRGCSCPHAPALPCCIGGSCSVGCPADRDASTIAMSGTCPAPGDAAACPMLGGQPAWVGCTRITASTNTADIQSCTCFATENGGAAWVCETSDAQ